MQFFLACLGTKWCGNGEGRDKKLCFFIVSQYGFIVIMKSATDMRRQEKKGKLSLPKIRNNSNK